MDNLKTILYPVEIIPLLHSVLETAGVGLFGTRHGQDGRRLRTLAVILAEISPVSASAELSRLPLFRIKWILFCPGGQKVIKWENGVRRLPKYGRETASGHGINVKALNGRDLLRRWRVK